MKFPFGLEIRRQPKPRSSSGRRHFAGAKQDRLTADWLLSDSGINDALYASLSALRTRSRDLSRNDPFVRRFMKSVRRNVVGPNGLTLRVQSPDADANEAIQRAWRIAGRSKALDITGRLTWVQMQQLFVRTVAQDGEGLIVKRQGEGPLGIAFQLVSPTALDVGLRQELRDRRRIRMGIELDANDRPQGYHFIDAEPGTAAMYASTKKWAREPADRVVHAYISEEIGQLRGIPWLHAVILRLKMMGAADEAALIALRVGASTMGILESTDEDGGNADITGADDESADGEPIFTVEAGTFRNLPRGRKLSMFKPEYPTAEYAPFHEAMLHGIVAGMDSAYSEISGNLSKVSFSGLRQGIIDARDVWMDLQGWLAWDFAQPCYASWLDVQLIAGSIKTRSGRVLSMSQFADYLDVTWSGRRWPWVDPIKDVQAAKLSVDELFRSRSSVIREMGGDERATWRETAEDNALLDEFGIELPSASTPAPQTEPESEDDEVPKNEKGERWLMPVENRRSAGAPVMDPTAERFAKAGPATNPPAELQMGMRERTMEIDLERAEKPDVESRTVRMSIASEDPYLTWILDQKTDWFGRAYEVLGHKPKEIRAARMKSGAAILVNHDPDQHVGVADKFWVDESRSYVSARFGKSGLAAEVFDDVVDGIRRFTSVRYRVYAYQLEREQKDGFPVYRAIDWEPVEGSIVSVPADPTVGVGRGANQAEPNVVHVVREEGQMDECTKCGKKRDLCVCAPAEGQRSATGTLPPPENVGGGASGGGGNGSGSRLQIVDRDEVAEERARTSEITAIAQHHPELREAADAAIRNGTPLDQFRKEALAGLRREGKVRNVSDTGADMIGVEKKDRKRFSFTRLMLAIGNKDRGLEDAADLELSVCRKTARLKNSKREFQIPDDVLCEPFLIPQGTPVPNSLRGYQRMPESMSRAFQAGDPDAGGYTVATELLSASFIELMMAGIVVSPLATTLTGLQGNISIPKQIGAAATSWLAEDGTATETSGQNMFGQVGMSPKTLASRAAVTRRLLLQSSLGIEAFIRMDLAAQRGQAIERAIIYGSGAANEPLGILNAPDRGSVAFGNVAVSWAKWVELMSDVMDANADFGSLAFLTNPVVYGQGLRVLKAAAAGGEFIFNEGRGRTSLGYQLMLSTNVPKNLGVGTNRSAAIFGNWAELLLGFWSGIDVQNDPYTGGDQGQIWLRLFQDLDVNFRHQQSFSAGVDIDHAV